MANQNMNQFLKERREKKNKIDKFRKKRIFKNYNKLKQNQNDNAEHQQIENDPSAIRKIEYYNRIMNEQKSEVQQKKKAQKSQVKYQPSEVDKSKMKLQTIKEKKKKCIKKMQHQKTKKGQPVMRNYIKYALTKIEETLQKEKLSKIKQTKNQKDPQINRRREN